MMICLPYINCLRLHCSQAFHTLIAAPRLLPMSVIVWYDCMTSLVAVNRWGLCWRGATWAWRGMCHILFASQQGIGDTPAMHAIAN
jgi:hypothetical protein